MNWAVGAIRPLFLWAVAYNGAMDQKEREQKETQIAVQWVGLFFGFGIFLLSTVFCFALFCFTFDDPNASGSIMAWIIRAALLVPPLWTAVEFVKMLNKAQASWRALHAQPVESTTDPQPETKAD
jgi:hypothetical protein